MTKPWLNAAGILSCFAVLLSACTSSPAADDVASDEPPAGEVGSDVISCTGMGHTCKTSAECCSQQCQRTQLESQTRYCCYFSDHTCYSDLDCCGYMRCGGAGAFSDENYCMKSKRSAHCIYNAECESGRCYYNQCT